MTSTPFSVDCLSLVRSVICQSPTLFNYELAPVPPSLINDYDCLRKSDKSILVWKLGSTIASPSDPEILLIDGNQLLYHVVWPVPGPVENIAASIKARLGTLSYKVDVIFDWYDGGQR